MEQNYLDSDPDGNLDCDLDHDPEDAPICMCHSLFDITKSVIIVFIYCSAIV